MRCGLFFFFFFFPMKQNSSNHLHSTSNSNCISDSPLFGWLVAFFTQSFASQTSMTKLISAMKVCWYGKVTVFCRLTWCCSMAGRQMRKVSSKTCLALLTHQLCGTNGAHQVSMATPSNWDLQTCGDPQHMWSKHRSVWKYLYKPSCNLV